MPNNTFKNLGQSGNVNQGRINSFIASSSIEELNDAASVAVSGGGKGVLAVNGLELGIDPIIGDPIEQSTETNVNFKGPPGAIKSLVNNLTAPGP